MSLNQRQLNILTAIFNGQSSDREISQALKLEINLVRYYLEYLEKELFIKSIKSWTHTGELAYSASSLTLKGKIAAQNPDDLIQPNNSQIINTGGGNYNKHIEGNYYEQSGTLGMGHMNGGEIREGATVAGIVNKAAQQDLKKAAAQIQTLLKQLDRSYHTDTTADKLKIAIEAIQRIESNPTLAAQILSTLKVSRVSSLAQFINHPAASFVINALEDWQKSRES